jgi:hypothetical protein
MTCNGDKEKKGRLVKRTVPKNAATGSGSGSTSTTTTSTSTADPVARSDTDSTSTSGTDSIKSGNASGSCIPSLKGVSL